MFGSPWLCLIFLCTYLTNLVSADNRSATVCTALKANLSSELVLPTDAAYANLTRVNWAATAWNTPACIAIPSSTESLQATVRALVQQQVRFAIRSGGHAVAPNYANIKNGVLIDMSGFNQVSFDAGKQAATIGSGMRWGDVYKGLRPFNMTAIGGRLLDVGVGGLILGGGLSYLTDKYGLACDNVLNFEVVLADGHVVNANASSEPDLFRALKGGSNNFGIVTRFTVQTYPIGPVWGGLKLYTHEQLPALVSAMAEYQAMPNKDPDANMMIQAPLTNTSIGAILNLIYHKPIANPAAFKPFENIPTVQDTTGIRTLEDFLANELELSPTDIPRWDFRTTTFALNESLYSEVLNISMNAPELANLSSITSGTLILGLQPIAATAVAQGEAKGSNSLGLKRENQMWLALDTGWWSQADDSKAYAVPRAIIERIEQVTKRVGAYHEYEFMNDASWDQQVLAHYGSANVASLKAAQARYDPTHVFQDLVVGGHKIPT